jgi:hypothetical protein
MHMSAASTNSGTGYDDTNTFAPSQNQLERTQLRRSNRIERANNNGSPYGEGRSANRNVTLNKTSDECSRGGQKAKKAKKGKKGGKGMQARAHVGEWDIANTPIDIADGEAAEMVSNISQGQLSNLSDASTHAWIKSMKALVGGAAWEDKNGAFVMDSLKSLILRCQRSEEMVAGLDFVSMVNMIQLVAKTNRYGLVSCSR